MGNGKWRLQSAYTLCYYLILAFFPCFTMRSLPMGAVHSWTAPTWAHHRWQFFKNCSNIGLHVDCTLYRECSCLEIDFSCMHSLSMLLPGTGLFPWRPPLDVPPLSKPCYVNTIHDQQSNTAYMHNSRRARILVTWWKKKNHKLFYIEKLSLSPSFYCMVSR